MIARALTAFAAVLVFVSCAVAQEAAPARTEPVGTTGTAPTTSTPVATTPAAVATPAAHTAAAAPAPAAAVETVAVDPRDYRVGPEDVLEINVWKNPDLSRPRVPVRPDGKISHPLINDIAVSGKTVNQIKSELTQRFSRFLENPEVSVTVIEVHSFKVSVQGNVRMPGHYEIKTPDVTVLDMIARAQGLNEFADKGGITVLRREDGRQRAIKFKYNDAIGGQDGANFLVQPGDLIVVN